MKTLINIFTITTIIYILVFTANTCGVGVDKDSDYRIDTELEPYQETDTTPIILIPRDTTHTDFPYVDTH